MSATALLRKRGGHAGNPKAHIWIASFCGSIMFAVIKTGGKQYKVAKDDIITVERLTADAGDAIELADVLMVGGENGLTVGAPTVSGASVKAEVLEQSRGKKIIVFKKKRRQNYRRKKGHRQDLTVLKVTDIVAS